MQEKLIVKGARQHNLKNINVEIPRNKLVVITGLSGSGKSSLAFDTIYAEGQRRYVESLSAYARQFLGQMDKPEVDYIEGLSPAISIDQKTTSRNPRSTVGTVTEIYDYLRLLFARAGEPHCPQCGKLIEQQSVQQIVDKVLELPAGTRFMVMAPLVRGRKGEHQRVLDDMRRAGYVRMYIDGEVRTLDEEIALEKNKKHSLSVVIDRLAVRENIHQRLTDSVETALKLADGFAEVAVLGEGAETLLFSEHFACNDCGISLPAIEPRLFSFNNPYGACPACTGLGMNMEFDKALIMPDPSLKFTERCLQAFSNNPNSYFFRQLAVVLASYGYSLDNSWNDLSPEVQNIVWNGAGERKFTFYYENLQGETKLYDKEYEGVINILKRRYREAFSDAMRQEYEEFMTSTPCPVCHGSRLKPEVLSILIGGKNICQVTALTVRDCLHFFANLKLTERQQFIARQVLKEIMARLQFLNDVGLDYLTLDRSAGTLSGGEAQRIRLATQIGSGLTGVLYILDEPSIGLHQRDNGKLLETLKHLRDLGNTLLV
ncbi:MAG: excinuclease ABC subunit UvrA, partial [Phascolarctobacterium sp.]